MDASNVNIAIDQIVLIFAYLKLRKECNLLEMSVG